MSNHGGMSAVYGDYLRLAARALTSDRIETESIPRDEAVRALKEIADLRFLVEDQRESIWQLEEQVSSLESSLNATRILLQQCEDQE